MRCLKHAASVPGACPNRCRRVPPWQSIVVSPGSPTDPAQPHAARCRYRRRRAAPSRSENALLRLPKGRPPGKPLCRARQLSFRSRDRRAGLRVPGPATGARRGRSDGGSGAPGPPGLDAGRDRRAADQRTPPAPALRGAAVVLLSRAPAGVRRGGRDPGRTGVATGCEERGPHGSLGRRRHRTGIAPWGARALPRRTDSVRLLPGSVPGVRVRRVLRGCGASTSGTGPSS